MLFDGVMQNITPDWKTHLIVSVSRLKETCRDTKTKSKSCQLVLCGLSSIFFIFSRIWKHADLPSSQSRAAAAAVLWSQSNNSDVITCCLIVHLQLYSSIPAPRGALQSLSRPQLELESARRFAPREMLKRKQRADWLQPSLFFLYPAGAVMELLGAPCFEETKRETLEEQLQLQAMWKGSISIIGGNWGSIWEYFHSSTNGVTCRCLSLHLLLGFSFRLSPSCVHNESIDVVLLSSTALCIR